MSVCWKKLSDTNYRIDLEYDGHEFEEIVGVPFSQPITISRRPAGDEWSVGLGQTAYLFTVRAATPELAQVGALAALQQWGDALGAALFALSQPKRHPLRPVRCAWCTYVGHDCGGGSQDPDGHAAYVSRQGDDVACSVWKGSGVTREITSYAPPDEADGGVQRPTYRQFTYDTNTWFVQGHYGSGHFDMALYKFVKNPPTEPADPVCDACVQRRIDAADLELITDHML